MITRLKVLLFVCLFCFVFVFVLAALGLHCCAWAFLWLWRVGATLRCGAWASHCSGFSCCRAWALGARASVVVVHGLSSCGSWALESTDISSCVLRALECRLSTCGAWA